MSWTVEKRAHVYAILGDDERPIAYIDVRPAIYDGQPVGNLTSRGRTAEELESIARLIAAAPDMLQALRDVCDGYQQMFDVMPVAWQTYDAIAGAAITKAVST
jgi:hypothetical protein